MEKTHHRDGHCYKLCNREPLQSADNEAEPHHWTGSQLQCLDCASRIYCYSIMDKAGLEVWDFIDSVYSTGEYSNTNVALGLTADE
ncbi:hypothetical protein Sjap_019412 [Stephania japonica]|uniref:Uncharacterized protein n=1 Tax=Stephania japonica TaxID=461633 RepID=A0AAP0F5Z0_9MAGN